MKAKQSQTQRKQNSPPKRHSRSSSPQQQHSHQSASEIHFASSAFLNSPDPSKLPVPDFDDDMSSFVGVNENDSSAVNKRLSFDMTSSGRKTDTLKQFLNIRPQQLVVAVSN